MGFDTIDLLKRSKSLQLSLDGVDRKGRLLRICQKAETPSRPESSHQ
jgi:hypothetical protein